MASSCVLDIVVSKRFVWNPTFWVETISIYHLSTTFYSIAFSLIHILFIELSSNDIVVHNQKHLTIKNRSVATKIVHVRLCMDQLLKDERIEECLKLKKKQLNLLINIKLQESFPPLHLYVYFCLSLLLKANTSETIFNDRMKFIITNSQNITHIYFNFKNRHSHLPLGNQEKITLLCWRILLLESSICNSECGSAQ